MKQNNLIKCNGKPVPHSNLAPTLSDYVNASIAEARDDSRKQLLKAFNKFDKKRRLNAVDHKLISDFIKFVYE